MKPYHRVVVCAATLVLAADVAAAQAPAVSSWSDSVTLESVHLQMRLPADGVRWQERAVIGSDGTRYVHLFGKVKGGHLLEVAPRFEMQASCDGWVEHMQSVFAILRSRGQDTPRERSATNPPWLPRATGWSERVWMGNACFDGGRQPMIIVIDAWQELDNDHDITALRTLLWYLGEAAAQSRTK